ncbi:MAG: hypothetical protein R6X02_30005 [Enhygromyxa sp.]
MSETVRVDLRQATLSDNARLREADDRLFLALDNPPPVRSLLRLVAGDEQKAFEVARVVEVVDEDEPARGCYGRYVELERLAEQDKVGSEHLEPGVRSGGGVPAPVVIMNSGEVLLGEAGEDSEEPAAGEAEASDAEAGEAGEDEGEASKSEPSESEPSESDDSAPE